MSRRLIPLLILLLALGLRVHGIGDKSLWFDEAATVRIVKQDFVQMFKSIRDDERTPPLHYLILHAWVRIFGDSEFSVRLPSALAGTAAVGALYLLTKRLFGFGAGCIAALLLATARFQIEYSQEARAYALLLLFSLLSTYLFVRLIDKPTRGLEIAYIVLAVLMMYSHLYGLFTLAAQNIAYFASFAIKRNPAVPIRRWIILQIAIVALFSPWIPIAIEWSKSVATGFWVRPMSVDDIAYAYWLYLGSIPMLCLCAGVVVLGCAVTRDKRAVVLMLALATLPVIVPIVVSILTTPSFTARYGIVTPAAIYALVGASVVEIRHRLARGVIVCALVLLSYGWVAAPMHKADWRGLAHYLEQRMQPGEYVVINPRLAKYLCNYYVRRTDITRKGFDSGAIPLGLDNIRVWLIYVPGEYRANEVIDRGNWRVLSSHDFDNLIVVELTNARS